MTSSRTVDIPADLDVRRTVRGAKLPVMVGPNGAWWSTRTPGGLGTLFIDRVGGDAVHGQAWGPGADWLLEQLPALLGLSDDSSSFEPDGIVGRLWARSPHRLSRTDRPWDAVVGAVLGQKVQVTRATRSRRMIARRFGDPAPGPAQRRTTWILPSPDTVAGLAYHDLHRCGIERRRADTLIGVANEVRRLDSLWDRPPAEVRARLEQIRGIGPWSSALVTAVAFGDPDAVPVGDFHVPNLVAWCLAGEPRATDERMLELLEPYRGDRWRVIRLAKDNGAAPRYGPRLSLTGDGLTRGS